MLTKYQVLIIYLDEPSRYFYKKSYIFVFQKQSLMGRQIMKTRGRTIDLLSFLHILMNKDMPLVMIVTKVILTTAIRNLVYENHHRINPSITLTIRSRKKNAIGARIQTIIITIAIVTVNRNTNAVYL